MGGKLEVGSAEIVQTEVPFYVSQEHLYFRFNFKRKPI